MSIRFSAGPAPPPNTCDARSSNWIFYCVLRLSKCCVIWFGRTSNRLASSDGVLSPRTAASATFALKPAEWLRRGRLVIFRS